MKLKNTLTASIVIFIMGMISLNSSAQTSGLIFVNPGITTLDPNGDGYVSQTDNGFSANDEADSEIDYKPIALLETEPDSDPLTGPDCSFIDMVGPGSTSPVMMFYDGSNVLFRFRLSGTSSQPKAYSILVDSDQKFGFRGSEADPNAVVGNPGFEFEIVLITGSGVALYNADGLSSPTVSSPASTRPYASYAHKSVAYTTSCSNPDYFYDFYVPISHLTIDENTPIRLVGATVMEPSSYLGSTYKSDVAGTDLMHLDEIFTCIPPVSISDFATANTSCRTSCPGIDPVSEGDLAVTGTSSEPDATVIEVFKNGSSIGTTTVLAGIWNLSPIAALAVGDEITATAKAGALYVSFDDCDIEVVGSTCTDAPSNIDVTANGKGIEGDAVYPSGTIIRLYTINGLLYTDPDVINPVTTTSNNQAWVIGHQVSFLPDSNYYVTAQAPDQCESVASFICVGYTNPSGTPVISTTPVLTTTVALNGTGGVSGAELYIYNGNDVIGNTSVSGAGWTASVSGMQACDSVFAVQVEPGKCYAGSSMSYVKTASHAPVITGNYCIPSASTVSTVTGTSVEAEGTIIEVYDDAVSVGTTTVSSDGSWQLTGLTIAVGSVITARVIHGPACLNLSALSSGVTVGQKTVATTLTISGTYTEGSGKTVNGSASPGSSTINLYLDGYLIGQETNYGTWSISGLTLYAGGSLTATLTINTAGYCESDPSSPVVVQCVQPAINKTINAVNAQYCLNEEGQIIIVNPDPLTVYTPVLNSDHTVFGYSEVSNASGSNLTLTTFPLTVNPTVLTVKATKLTGGSCSVYNTNTVSLQVNPLPDQNLAVSAYETDICPGDAVNITIANAEDQVSYQLKNAADDSNIGIAQTGNGSDLTISTGPLTEDITIYVTATDIATGLTTFCSLDLANTVSITVGGSDSDQSVTVDDAFLCQGHATNIRVLTHNDGHVYQVRRDSDDEPVGALFTGDGTEHMVSSDILTSNETFYVEVFDNGICYTRVTDEETVTVDDCLTDIYIQKTVDDATPDENQAVTFTVTVTNNGPLDVHDLVITDVIPAGLTPGTITPSTGTWSSPDWSIGTLTTSGTATLTIEATVDAGTSLSVITNTVTNTQYETDNNATTDDNDEDLYITGTADLSVTTQGSELTPTNIVFTVTLSSANNTGSPITFEFDDLGTGSAISGSDYTAIGGSAQISVPNGSTTGTYTVIVTDDTFLESTETLDAQISNPSFPGISITTATATANIADDETAGASLSVTTHGSETGPTNIIYTVTLTQDNHTGSAITFDFDDLGTGTATSGDDYTAIGGSAQITVADGASTGTISVTVIDDALFESTETINAQISNSSNPSVTITTTSATANITDNETADAELSVTVHGNETTPTHIEYTVTLSRVNNTGVPITFEFDDAGTGTATTGSDYSAISGSAQISVANGASTGTIIVTVLNDALFELTETLNCTISNPSNGNVSITTASATANITDNDAPNAVLSVTQHGNEAGPIAVIYTVSLDHANGTGSAITFDFDDAGTGTSTSGDDYTAIGGSAQITVADGASTGTISVTVIDDALFELTETLNCTISNPSNGNVSITTATATANITDNDAPNALLSVTQHGNEAGSIAVIYTVSLDHANGTGSVITFDFDDVGTGTATSGDDYTAIGGSAQITVADGASTGTISVTVIDDALFESTETLDVQISNPSIASVIITGATASGNISDNETATADLSVTVDGNETTPTHIEYTVTLSRVNNTGVPITFEFDDAGTGTATTGSDYTAISGSAQITVANGASTGTFTVTVLNDALFEITETLNCTISGSSNGSVTVTTATATANIIDNDAPNAVLSVTQDGAESGPTNIGYTVTLDHANGTGSPITFDFDDAGTGTATSGDDYTAIGGSAQITVADGASTGTISVIVIDDALFESSETINAEISNPSNALVTITGANATGNIADNETSNAVLSVTTHGNETGPVDIVYTVTIDRVNNTNAPITFEFDNSGTGTAISGSDYTAISGSAQISIAAGASTGTFTISVTDDALFELTETVICNINTPSNLNVNITTGTATANITDNDAPDAVLSVTQNGNEAGPVHINYTVTLDHVNGTGVPITFEFDDAGTGTATSGDDYTAIGGSAQITVADGASTGTISVTVIDDALFELTETLNCTISNPSNGNVSITTATATANITDNDAPNALLSVTQHGNEAGSIAVIYTVSLDHANGTGSVITFDFDDVGTGTATSGDDYTAIGGSAQITVADGASTGTISVTVIDDALFESTETINAQISNSSNPSVTITTGSATANITDNETADAELSVTLHGNETTPTHIEYTVTLSRENNTGIPITFEFDDAGTGTATSGNDYTAIGGSVQISVANGASTGTIIVTVLNDALFELTETLNCTISNPSNGNVSITTATATANIIDNDAPNAVLSVTQDGTEAGPTNIEYTVTLDHANGTGSAITFDFDDAGTGTATSGDDYTAIGGSAQITVADGASTGTISVTVLNDALFELTETLNCTISNPSNGNVSITTATATANVTDNDAPNAVLSVTTTGDEEGPIALVYTVTLNHENRTGSAITFDFDDAGTGTATTGDDYTTIDAAAQISIPDGSSIGSISVNIIDDGLFEGTETLITQISNPGNALVVITGPSATGTIIDNDGVNVYLSVSTQGNETGPVDIVYTATLSLANNTGIPLTFDFDDLLTGTALSGIDYTSVELGAIISVADGASQGSITIPVLDDALLESPETIIAQISNPSHGDISIVTSTATATISDDENALADLSVSVNGNESGPIDLVYRVTLSTVNHTGSDISFDFDDLFTGTALNGDDYSTIDDAAKISVADGDDFGIITVPVINDGLLESIETLIAGISNPSFPSVSINTATAIGTILDNETATADLTVSSDGNETGPENMVYTVTLSLINNTGSAITFDFDDLMIGTANTGLDYISIGVNDVISVADGMATGTYSVVVIDDDVLESTETFSAQISNPSFGAVSILSSEAGSSILDNEIADADLSVTTNGEESGPVDMVFTVTLSLENQTGLPITFDFDDLLTGTATVGVDYTAVDPGAQITINNESNIGTLSVQILDDVFYEPTETIIGQISNPSFGAINISTSDAFGNIIDDDYADVHITKTVDNDNPQEGDQIIYSITVTNYGPSPLTNLVVTDIIPTGLTFVDATPSTGTWTAPDWTIGSLPVGNTETLLLTVNVDAGTGGIDITNTVSNTQDQLDDNTTADDLEETIHIDDLPIANNDVFDVNEDESLEGDLLLNDTGLNDGGLTVTIVTDVVNGTLNLNADGSFVYHPIANYHGTDNFVYQVCDGDNDCDQASVNITVISVDDFPLAQDDAISVGEDSELFTLYVLADNGNGADDFGGDGPSIGSINLISTSTNGTTELNDGSTPNDPTDDYFIYTPNRNYFGPDAFEYEICDSDGDCDHAIVYIEVINDEVLFFPEVITPNNDGYNDYFVIEGLELFPDNLLIILNRWGNKVFEASPYQNDWNGINQSGLSPGGEELQEGTYYYILKTNNEREDIKGYIYIKR